MNNYGMEVRLARYQSCGFYNDPDFLIVDWPDLSLDEKKTQFALWSSFSAPLILSAYIPDLTNAEIEYLTNKDIIAVDQDALCEQATLVSQDGYIDVLTKNLANGDRLLTVLNRGNGTKTTEIPLARVGLNDTASCTVRDLWTNKTSTVKDSISVKLRTHQTAILRISPHSYSDKKLTVTPTGMIFNTLTLNCLAGHRSGSVTTAPCNAADAQVWQISSSGLVRPLSVENQCLAVDGKKVTLAACDQTDASQQWSYGISGNLANKEKGLCLEEGKENVSVGTCGTEKDGQVFALPGGVKLQS